MKPEEFLELANRLTLLRSSRPPEFRTAISRAYYAVFHLARQFLNSKMQFHCKAREHEHLWVQRHFMNCKMLDAREAGRLIQNMHDARKDADYELSDTGIETVGEAKLSLERSTQVVKLLELCGSESNFDQIRAEMLQYRKLAGVQ